MHIEAFEMLLSPREHENIDHSSGWLSLITSPPPQPQYRELRALTLNGNVRPGRCVQLVSTARLPIS